MPFKDKQPNKDNSNFALPTQNINALADYMGMKNDHSISTFRNDKTVVEKEKGMKVLNDDIHKFFKKSSIKGKK